MSNHRSWTKLGVMIASQRDELLKRVVKDYPSEKLSFKVCGKIVKDINLTLEQVTLGYDLLICFLTSGMPLTGATCTSLFKWWDVVVVVVMTTVPVLKRKELLC